MNRRTQAYSQSYEAAPDDNGAEGRLFNVANLSGELTVSAESLQTQDQEIVREAVEQALAKLHGTDRHAKHNKRLVSIYDEYSQSDGANADPDIIGVDHMAILLHDFGEDGILQPEKTARKCGLPAEKAMEIKSESLAKFNEMYDKVTDQDGLTKAFLFAVDASEWEAAARIWRDEAQSRIDEMVRDGTTSARNGEILLAAVNKADLPKDVTPEEHEQVLRNSKHCLINLRLGAIKQSTLNHNIRGIFLKGLETLDNIKHPPAGNPASTYRDCIEVINFFVPALMTLGYKGLATDLHGVALEWFYADPLGHAKRQHELSRSHFNEIKETVADLREQEFGGYDIKFEARIKTEGSIRQKLAEEDRYANCSMVPDGVGLAFVVPDEMVKDGEIEGSELSHFAWAFRSRLINSGLNVEVSHPAGDATYEEKEKNSGYQAVHMTFYFHTADGIVPVEIQVMTKQQYRLKLYGESSDIFYKFGKQPQPTAEELDHLEHQARRAEAERTMAPGTTVQSIGNMVAKAPELPSVFNKLFAAVDTANGVRVLVPKGMESALAECLRNFEAEGEAGDLAVLPPLHVSQRQFQEAINMFGRNLSKDRRIQTALLLVQGEASETRNDMETSVLEGHLLPTALQALIMAIQSGIVWEGNTMPEEHMANITTIAILHDYVEDELKRLNVPDWDVSAVYKARTSLYFTLRSKFGTTIADSVLALTAPTEAEMPDEFIRREDYAQNIQSNKYAQIIKPGDRWQNHMTDIAKLFKPEVDEQTLRKAISYFDKTDRHLSQLFTANDMPELYRRVHGIIWHLAESKGYSG